MKYKNKEWLYNEYVTKRKTQKQIAEEIGITLPKLEYWIKKLGLIGSRNRFKYKFDDKFINLNCNIYMYFCGLIASDGYCDRTNNRVSIRIHKRDQEPIIFLSKYYRIPYKYYRSSIDLTISSRELMKSLEEINLNIKNKTYNLDFPVFQTDQQYKYFIRGFLDGDGNIRDKGFRASIASKKFMVGLIEYLNNKFNYDINLTWQNNKYSKIEVNGRKAITILKWVYSDNQELAIKRKVQKVNQMTLN